MIWSKKCLVGPRMAPDVVKPRTLELEVAKEILSVLFDIRTHEVDEMVRQRMEKGRYTVKSSVCPLPTRFVS
ncbi:MAG: hypothetical protein LUQ38_10980 [Methanotrichaceae archaeon]|nr:hypothetical protein [Methanotrichaceae archaeon]